MRQTATYVQPAPSRLQLLLWLAAFLLAWLIQATTAEAAQPTTVVGSIRHTRRMTRITVLRPARVQGRAQAGYPMLQTAANVTRIGVNLSGLINPIGWFF